MAPPSVITELSPIMEDALWGKTPYALSIKGQPEPRVKVKEVLDVNTGETSVEIIALVDDDKPVLALSTLDQIARRIKPDARVQHSRKGSVNMVRLYK
jgi:hypothetical protein